MLRILHIIDSLRSGGKERQLIELLSGLDRGAHLCSVVVLSDEIHYKLPDDLISYIIILKRRTKKDPLIFYDLYKVARSFHPDVIHVWDSMSAVYTLPIAKLLRVTLINGMIRDAFLNRTWFDKDVRRSIITFMFSDCIIANSFAGLRAYHVKPGKGMCIYNGFNFDRINKLQDVEVIRDKFSIHTPYVVGMVASFSTHKDHKTFIKAAQAILDLRRDITFVMIGDGPTMGDCQNMVTADGRHNIKFLGKCCDVESIVNIFNVGVLTTFTEGISNSILEYMALEKPVVATYCAGNAELVVNNQTGFLTKQGDYHDLFINILTLINDIHLAKAMGLNGRQRIIDYFSIDNMVHYYSAIYNNLACCR